MLNRLRNNWIGISLTIMVVLSLVLSAIVWISPYHFERRAEEGSRSEQQTTSQSMQDIYLPSTIIHVKSDGSQQFLYDQPRNLMLTVKESLRNWQLRNGRRISSNNSGTYLSYLRRSNSLLLSYPATVPLTIFNDSFNSSLSTDRISRVNHVVLPLNDSHHIYLLSDSHFQVYRINVRNMQVNEIKKAMRGGHQFSVDHKIVNNRPFVTYPNGIKLPEFAYRISSFNVDNVSQALMNSSRKGSISTQTDGDVTTYTDSPSRHLNYNHKRGTLDYEHYLGKDQHYSYQQIFGHLYDRLSKSTISMDSLRYDSYNSKSKTITYRSYVENFPVFNEDGYGEVRIQLSSEGVERYHFSRYTPQVPLPVNDHWTHLPSSAVVFNELRNNNHLKDITGLRVGYQWQSNQSDNTVMLRPTYYVHYRGNWVDYRTLIK